MVVTVPPAIANLPNGRYAVSGGTWVRVPDDTKFEDLDKVSAGVGSASTSSRLRKKTRDKQ